MLQPQVGHRCRGRARRVLRHADDSGLHAPAVLCTRHPCGERGRVSSGASRRHHGQDSAPRAFHCGYCGCCYASGIHSGSPLTLALPETYYLLPTTYYLLLVVCKQSPGDTFRAMPARGGAYGRSRGVVSSAPVDGRSRVRDRARVRGRATIRAAWRGLRAFDIDEQFAN